jgi:hypothetical protein
MVRTKAALDWDDIISIWNSTLREMQLPAETPEAPSEATSVMSYPKGAARNDELSLVVAFVASTLETYDERLGQLLESKGLL